MIPNVFHRVNYIKFLEPFSKHRRGFRHGHNMQAVMKHPQAELVRNKYCVTGQIKVLVTQGKKR